MECPNCGHAVTKHGVVETVTWFWCGRCGSLIRTEDGLAPQWHTPQLVARCRKYQKEPWPDWRLAWKDFGIEEAIWP